MAQIITQESSQIPALVVGTGHGVRVLVPALRASGFSVVGLVGRDPERTQKRAESSGVAAAFTQLDTAIASTGAVAVAVATPPLTHAPLVHTALSRGCHVLCEKPFARDAAEAYRMLAAAQRAGVVHLIGNQFRMLPERAVLARAISDGLVGEPRLVTITQYSEVAADPEAKWPAWWFNAQAGGGWLGASGSHAIDMIRTWLGEFASVSAKLTLVSDRRGVAEDTYLMRFTMANGVEGMLMQTGGARGESAVMSRVAGTRGTLSVEHGRVSLSDRHGTRQLPVPPELVLSHVARSEDPRKRYAHIELPPAIRLCEAWRGAILGEAAGSVPAATFADGVACMEVIDAARASAAAGGACVGVPRRAAG